MYKIASALIKNIFLMEWVLLIVDEGEEYPYKNVTSYKYPSPRGLYTLHKMDV
jgi:hypothetical protein